MDPEQTGVAFLPDIRWKLNDPRSHGPRRTAELRTTLTVQCGCVEICRSGPFVNSELCGRPPRRAG